MLLLPVITFAVAANTVELDYNVQIGPSKTITTSVTSVPLPTAQTIAPVAGGLHIGHADVLSQQNRHTDGLQFAAGHAQGFAFQSLRTQGIQFATGHTQGFSFQRPQGFMFTASPRALARPAGPWPERAVNLPWIPGGRERVMIPKTSRP